MAQKKGQDNYDDALGSIFDFLFTEANKPPDKRRPIKPTGISGDSEFVDALGTVIENPAAFVSNTVMDSMNDAFNGKVFFTETDSRGNELEIKANDIAGILKDPNTFFKKQYEKQKSLRKQSHIRWFAPSIQQVVTEAYARKAGLDPKDAKILGQATKRAMAEKGYISKGKYLGDDAGGKAQWDQKVWDQNYGLDLAAKSYQGKDVIELNAFVNELQEEDQVRRFTEAFSKSMDISANRGDYSRELRRFQQQIRANGPMDAGGFAKFFNESEKLSDDKKLKINAFIIKDQKGDNPILPQSIDNRGKRTWNNNNLDVLSDHYDKKAKKARFFGREEDAEKAQTAKNVVDSLREQKLIAESPKKLIEIRKEIRSLKKNDPKSDRLKELLKEEDYWKNVKRYGQLSKFGQIEGIVGSWKATYTTTKDLIPNMLNGNFFDNRGHKNPFLSPSHSFHKVDGIKIHSANYGKGTVYNKEVAELLNEIYYITPAGIISTLTTGEGFAYLLSKSRKNFGIKVKNLDAGSKSFLNDLKMLNSDGSLDFGKWQKFVTGENKEENLKKLFNYIGQNPDSKMAKSLVKFLENEKRLGKLAKFFSFGSDFQKAVEMGVKKGLNKFLKLGLKDELGDYTAGRLIGKFIGSKIWTDKMQQFITSKLGEKVATQIGKELLEGGLKVGLKAFIESVLVAGTSIAGTPIAGAIVWVATEIVMDIGFKMVKEIILFLMILALGVFATVTISVFGGIGAIAEKINVHSHIAPTEIEECNAFMGIEPIIDDPDDITGRGPLGEFVAGALPSGVQCLLGEGSYRCSQGAYGSFSHQNVAANDYPYLGYFHAPTFCNSGEGNCKVTYNGPVNCTAGYAGGLVIFTASYGGTTYEFKLIHVASNFSVGQSLDSGERVARIMTWEETGNACSTGAHLHLETKVNGAVVDPYEVMTSPVSEGGFGCSISACP